MRELGRHVHGGEHVAFLHSAGGAGRPGAGADASFVEQHERGLAVDALYSHVQDAGEAEFRVYGAKHVSGGNCREALRETVTQGSDLRSIGFKRTTCLL